MSVGRIVVLAIGIIVILVLVWRAIVKMRSQTPEHDETTEPEWHGDEQDSDLVQETQADWREPQLGQVDQMVSPQWEKKEPHLTVVENDVPDDNPEAEDIGEAQDVDAESEAEQQRQAQITEAAQAAVASSQGGPEQAELHFEDQDSLSWDEAVQESLARRLDQATGAAAKPEQVYPHHLLVINVLAPRGYVFAGDDITAVLQQQGLQYSEKKIFEAVSDAGDVAFSVASMVEPGTFNLELMHLFTTPGLGFFLDLQQVSQPKHAFKQMLATVHEVATQLGGDILDHEHQRLTESTLSRYLAEIKATESLRASRSTHVG